MALDLLEHYTIRCFDVELTRTFYRDVLGLEVGFRPELGFAGYWIYCGKTPAVHLVPLSDPSATIGNVNPPRSDVRVPVGTGAIDHIAFRGTDDNGMIKRLKARPEFLKENIIDNIMPGAILHQIFLNDPNGVTVELNFRVPKER